MSNDNSLATTDLPEAESSALPMRSNRLAFIEGGVLIFGLSFLEQVGLFSFAGWPVHPFLFVVMLLGAQYGLAGGVLAAFAATAVYHMTGSPVRPFDMSSAAYFWVAWGQPLSWVFAALTVGLVTSHRTRLLAEQAARLQKAVRAERLIAAQYHVLAERTHQLERSLAGRADSGRAPEKDRKSRSKA